MGADLRLKVRQRAGIAAAERLPLVVSLTQWGEQSPRERQFHPGSLTRCCSVGRATVIITLVLYGVLSHQVIQAMYFVRKFLRYLFSFSLTKRLFNSVIPVSIRRKITKGLHLDTGPFNRPISDVRLIPIQDGSYLAVYFKNYRAQGIGPGVSLYVLENEILRFDCFGGVHGHYHSMPCLTPYPEQERIRFNQLRVEGQIDESAEEIISHHARHLIEHFRHRIRLYAFEPAKLAAAVDEARDVMRATSQDAGTAPPPQG